jgi:hypothetical protein
MLINITEKPSSQAGQVYLLQADWGYDESPLLATGNGTNADVSFVRTVTITGMNFTPLFTAVRELSLKAAKKLRNELLLKKKYVPFYRPHSGDWF